MGGDELLGMSVIEEPASLLHNTVPAPKVIQNQLDHLLEGKIYDTEEKLLKELQKLIRRRTAVNGLLSSCLSLWFSMC